LARAVAQLSDIALDERADIRDGVDLTLDLRGADLIVLTPTSVAGVAVGGSAANAEKKMRQLLGAPTAQDNVPGCSLSTPASDSRRLTSWGSLALVAGSSGSSKGKVVGWTVRAGPLPATVRLPYSVTTATPVSSAMKLVPGATAQWDDVFQMYMITTPQASGMVWSGERADGSGRITYISNAFEPCE
jgi:hypothetical protein